MESFTALQLDVFHALRELYCPQHCYRPAVLMTKVERSKIAWEEARSVALGTRVRKGSMDKEEKLQEYDGGVFDFRTSYYRIRYGDGDWEEMTKAELP